MRAITLTFLTLLLATSLNGAQSVPNPGAADPGAANQNPTNLPNNNPPGVVPGSQADNAAGATLRAADGVYVILAYERNGIPIPVVNRPVTIRNNVMTLNTGDANTGKTFLLRFLPNNMIRLVEVDPRTFSNPGNGQPVTIQQTGAAAGQAGINGATGRVNTALTTEMGVYVLSNEFFAISVFASVPGGGGVNPPLTGVDFPPTVPFAPGQGATTPPAKDKRGPNAGVDPSEPMQGQGVPAKRPLTGVDFPATAPMQGQAPAKRPLTGVDFPATAPMQGQGNTNQPGAGRRPLTGVDFPPTVPFGPDGRPINGNGGFLGNGIPGTTPPNAGGINGTGMPNFAAGAAAGGFDQKLAVLFLRRTGQ